VIGSVRAARSTDVIAVGRADFTELLHGSPALSLALNRSLGHQLHDRRTQAPTARPRPTTVALIAHMQVGGDGVDLVALYSLGLVLNFAALLWSCGIAMRLRTIQAGPVIQLPVFLGLFFVGIGLDEFANPRLRRQA